MCNRPLDWSPLERVADPVPGCPGRVSLLVDELSTVATRMRAEGTTLEEIEADSDDPDVWDSEAARDFLHLQRDLRPDLELVADRYSTAADALADYMLELAGAQADSEAALALARQAQGQLEEAGTGMKLQQAAEAAGEDWTGADHEQQQAEARALLSQAMRDLEEAIARRERAADVAASAIAGHIDSDGLANPGDISLSELARRVAEDPSLWGYLSPAERRQLMEHDPELIGNLDGIPTVDRDAANRINLARARDELEQRRSELVAANADGRYDDEIARIDRQLAGMGVIEDRLGSAPDGREAYLLGFSLEPERAIVAVGNPDEADNVLTYVPGTGTGLNGSLRNDLNRVDVMADDAARLDEDASTATIMWLGYDAPPGLIEATSPYFAEGGAGALTDFQAGLGATHVAGGANYTVVGHSYGSTVIGHAAKAGPLNAESLVFVGSPGVGANNVSDLGMDPDQVFVTSAFHDPINLTPGAIHGTNPRSESFGATEFRSDTGPLGMDAHSSYWDDGNQFRESMATITTGHHDQVRLGRETPGWFDVVDVGSHAERVGDAAGAARDAVVDGAEAAGDWVSDRASDLGDLAGDIWDKRPW